MRFIWRSIMTLVVLTAVLYVAGARMPRDHVVASRINLAAPADSVWSVLRAFGDYPTWDLDFKSSVRGPSRHGREVWVLKLGGITMSIEVKESAAPRRLVAEIITGEQSWWGGVWTYEIKATSAATEVTITEDAWVEFPPLRVLMKVMGQYRTTDRLLKNLAARFDETAPTTHVR